MMTEISSFVFLGFWFLLIKIQSIEVQYNASTASFELQVLGVKQQCLKFTESSHRSHGRMKTVLGGRCFREARLRAS